MKTGPCVLALAALLMVAPPGAAQQRLTVIEGGGLDGFLAGLATAELSLDAGCEEARAAVAAWPEGARLEIATAPGGGPEVAADRLDADERRAVTDTAAAILDMLARLGAPPPSERYVFRREPGGLFVGSDQRGGRIFADACAGLGHFARLVMTAGGAGAAPGLVEAAARSGATTPGGLVNAAREAAGPLATLTQGSRARLRLAASATPADGEARAPRRLVGGPGVSVERVSQGGDGALDVEVAISGDAAPGDAALHEFADGDRVAPRATHRLAIVGGASPPAQPAPVNGAARALTPGTRVAGSVAPGATQRYEITATRAGDLSLQSSGQTDVAARLIGPDGAVVASDDDGGGDYQFAITTAVTPGRYTLEVDHCCAGRGAFTLDSRLD